MKILQRMPNLCRFFITMFSLSFLFSKSLADQNYRPCIGDICLADSSEAFQLSLSNKYDFSVNRFGSSMFVKVANAVRINEMDFRAQFIESNFDGKSVRRLSFEYKFYPRQENQCTDRFEGTLNALSEIHGEFDAASGKHEETKNQFAKRAKNGIPYWVNLTSRSDIYKFTASATNKSHAYKVSVIGGMQGTISDKESINCGIVINIFKLRD